LKQYSKTNGPSNKVSKKKQKQKQKQTQNKKIKNMTNSNMTSFFSFVNKRVSYPTLAENVAHNLCNSNNTVPSIGIIRVTIYAANGKSVTFTGACGNEIIPNR
jgi:hypothetical protein